MGVFPRSPALGALGPRCRGGEHNVSSAMELSSWVDPSIPSYPVGPRTQGSHRRQSPELGTWVGGKEKKKCKSSLQPSGRKPHAREGRTLINHTPKQAIVGVQNGTAAVASSDSSSKNYTQNHLMNPASPLLGVDPRELKGVSQRGIHTPMFTAASVTIG